MKESTKDQQQRLQEERETLYKLQQRIQQLQKQDAEIEESVQGIIDHDKDSAATLHQHIHQAKHELKVMKDEIKELRQHIFVKGHELKKKLPQKEFEEFSAKVDEWKLEEFITKDELETTYKYWKQQGK